MKFHRSRNRGRPMLGSPEEFFYIGRELRIAPDGTQHRSRTDVAVPFWTTQYVTETIVYNDRPAEFFWPLFKQDEEPNPFVKSLTGKTFYGTAILYTDVVKACGYIYVEGGIRHEHITDPLWGRFAIVGDRFILTECDDDLAFLKLKLG